MTTMTAAAAATGNPYMEAARAKKVSALARTIREDAAQQRFAQEHLTREFVGYLSAEARRRYERAAGFNKASDATWAAVALEFPSFRSRPAAAPVPPPLACKTCLKVLADGEGAYRSGSGLVCAGCHDAPKPACADCNGSGLNGSQPCPRRSRFVGRCSARCPECKGTQGIELVCECRRVQHPSGGSAKPTVAQVKAEAVNRG